MKLKTMLLAAIITIAIPQASFAQTETRGIYYSLYGQHFLNGWQSLRLVADNPRYSDSEIIPCVRVTMIVSFFELPSDGSVLVRPMRRVTRQIELDPGDVASFDIPAALACGDGSVCPQLREGVYAGVSVFTTPVEGEPVPARLKFNTTLSLREFGRTIFTLPATEKGFDPQPDPPALR